MYLNFGYNEIVMTLDCLNGVLPAEDNCTYAKDHIISNVGWCIANEGVAEKHDVSREAYMQKLHALTDNEAKSFLDKVHAFWDVPTYSIPNTAERVKKIFSAK